jgi:anti-sigma B factor antagonist
MSEESMTVRTVADVKIVDVNADLGSYEAADLRRTLDDLVTQNTRKILVNLSPVQHISSVAIGAMVGALKRLNQQGGDLKVFGLAENIKRTFDLVGATGVIEVYNSEGCAFDDF